MDSPTAKVIEHMKVFGNENLLTGKRLHWWEIADKYQSDAKWAGAEPIYGRRAAQAKRVKSRREKRQQKQINPMDYIGLV